MHLLLLIFYNIIYIIIKYVILRLTLLGGYRDVYRLFAPYAFDNTGCNSDLIHCINTDSFFLNLVIYIY